MNAIIKSMPLYLVFILSAVNIIGCTQSKSPDEQAMADDRIEIAAIVRDIQENGPPELRRLPESVIREPAQNFVFGKRYGSISSNQMARMGGARQATEDALMGELKAEGLR
jgi:hypothetical protein